MKKIIVILVILFVFIGLTIALLDFFKIWSITGAVREAVENHPRIQPYLLSAEERAAMEKEITLLQEELQETKGEKNELGRINASLEDLVERYQDRIDELEAALEGQVKEAEDREDRIRQLAGVYSQMKPNEAAVVLEGLEDDLVIDLFLRWEDRFAARVLAEMEPARSARLTEILSE